MFEKLGGRKFFSVLVFGVLVVCNEVFDLGLSQEALLNILYAIGGFVVVEGAADVATRVKGE